MAVLESFVVLLVVFAPLAAGFGLGRFAEGFERLLIGAGLVPAAYFALNFAVAVVRGGLEATLFLAIPLGDSPVWILVLTIGSFGFLLGIVIGRGWVSPRARVAGSA